MFPPSFHSPLILLLFILYREENEELKKELQEIKSRLGGDFSKLNVRFFLKNLITICNISLQSSREDMITRNFGIMNDFFLAMNDDCDNRIEDKNIFQAEDPWSDRPASDLNTPNTTKVR